MFSKLSSLFNIIKELPSGSTKEFTISILSIGMLLIFLFTFDNFTEIYRIQSQSQVILINTQNELKNTQNALLDAQDQLSNLEDALEKCNNKNTQLEEKLSN